MASPPESPLSAAGDIHRALLAAIIADSQDAVISKTLDSVVTSWNLAAERLFGWSADEMVGQSILRVIPPDLQFEEDDILARLRSGQRIERYETTRVRKDGTRFDVSLTISPIKDAAGNIVGASKIAHDITERRLAEAALKALADEARALEILSRVGQSVGSEFDLEVIVQRITDAATELSGASFGAFFYNVTSQDGQGSYWLYSISGVPREKFEGFPMPRATEVFAPTFRGEGIVRSDNIRLDPRFGHNPPYQGMPEGHLPVTSYLAVPVVSRSGEVIGGLFLGHPDEGMFSDRAERLVNGIASQAAIAIDNSRLVRTLTEREARLSQLLAERDDILASERAARSEAERLGQLKDEFLATLSHELRTPLNAVHGWTQILLRGQKSDDQAQALAVIERNVRAQSQIISDLLDMSRIVSGKIDLEIQTIQLQQVIKSALDTVRQTAETKKIRINTMLGAPIVVRADPNRLQQVLWNIFTNAIKFTPSGGRIQVVVERVNSHVELSVEDTGIGIRPEFLPFIFDRFRQADASTTRRFGGLGLGLSIVKNMVELHGGNVRVKSPGENQGSTFTVSLPVSHVQPPDAAGDRAREEANAAALDSAALPLLDGARILIVDDEADGRALLVRILSDRHASCGEAGSAAEALAKLATERFDMLLSDVGMPGMDGYELIRQVRDMDSSRSAPLPAIAITAYARSEDRQRSLIAGFNSHLSKPIETRELVATIAGLLRLTR